MTRFSYIFLLLIFCIALPAFSQPSGNTLINKGWEALVSDRDKQAFNYFWQAHKQAEKSKDTAANAEALLYLGICTYGASPEKGLHYATQSLNEYKKVSTEQALTGRARCLQLISTIYIRQGKPDKARVMSSEAVEILKSHEEKTGTLGLAYNTLAKLSEDKNDTTLAKKYYSLALKNFRKYNNEAYLPSAYIKMGDIDGNLGNYIGAAAWYNKAMQLAESTRNRQAQASVLLAMGRHNFKNLSNAAKALQLFTKAHTIAQRLSDKAYEIKTLEALINVYKQQGNFARASQYQEQLIILKDNYNSAERDRITKTLEVQFEVSEKERQLEMANEEKKLSYRTSYFLGGLVLILIAVFGFVYYSLKTIGRRDKELLKTREQLLQALEEQKLLQEEQFKNDMDYKESQLSAVTLQMLQKNELVDELKLAMNENSNTLPADHAQRIINRYAANDANWDDFDKYFESINKNFYTRLKQTYPGISGNDLKICALIKLNLSIKEMAAILNISPDSVKTARYRLRKKLQLNTEDNLTDFILSI